MGANASKLYTHATTATDPLMFARATTPLYLAHTAVTELHQKGISLFFFLFFICFVHFPLMDKSTQMPGG